MQASRACDPPGLVRAVAENGIVLRWATLLSAPSAAH